MKKVGYSIYIHKSNIKELNPTQKDLVEKTIKFLPKRFNFQIIKINFKNNTVSFIESNNWDKANEPNVGNSWIIDVNGLKKLNKSKGQIYHHKWMFVSEDYDGFDVVKSKKRSESWENVIPKSFKSKIGYKKFWNEILKQYDLEL